MTDIMQNAIEKGIKSGFEKSASSLGAMIGEALKAKGLCTIERQRVDDLIKTKKEQAALINKLKNEIFELECRQCPHADTDFGVICDEYGDNHTCRTITAKLTAPKEQ